MDETAASKVFRFAEMPVRKMANGGESRDVMRGKLVTGEVVALHESMQVAGMAPNPMHRIEHTEVIMVQDGTMEFKFEDHTERERPGHGVLRGEGHQPFCEKYRRWACEVFRRCRRRRRESLKSKEKK